jgi:hypothetical protein
VRDMTEIAHAVVSLMILILKHLLYSALLYSATAIKVLTTAAGQQATRTRFRPLQTNELLRGNGGCLVPKKNEAPSEVKV